jgi:hypothetical protein
VAYSARKLCLGTKSTIVLRFTAIESTHIDVVTIAGGVVNTRVVVFSGLCLVATVLTSAALAQSGIQAMAGTWKIEGAAPHDGLPAELVLRVSDSEVTLARKGATPEVYKFDVTQAGLPSGSSAEFAGESLTLTRTRTTFQGNTGPYVTTIRQVYRASQNYMTLESRVFARGPEDPAGKWSEVQRGAYRRTSN